MKKTYLFIFAFLSMALGYAQSPIVVIDASGTTTATPTDSDTLEPNITSQGLTRGSGIIPVSFPFYNSEGWEESDLSGSQTANEYVEWSVSADAGFKVTVSTVDFRVGEFSSGPIEGQLLYSLDGFATAGTDITGPINIITGGSNNTYSLSADSGDGGTITFRFFAWDAPTAAGDLFFQTEFDYFTPGSDIIPGVRLSGTVEVVGGPTADEDSDIITTAAFDPTDNIDYTAFSVASGLTTANALQIGQFTIRDGGATAPDADNLDTILTDLEFNVAGFENIAALALFDGSTNIGEITDVTSTTVFSAINSTMGVTVADDGFQTIEVYATFKNNVIDNSQLQLTVTSATAGIAGSLFAAADAGGAQTPIAGDDNRIEVTATQLIYSTQPSITTVDVVMTPGPAANAVDANSNLDLDFTGTVTVVSTGTLSGTSTTSVAAVNGVATFANLIHTVSGTGFTLTTSAAGLTDGVSTTFNIVDSVIQVIAFQDFDFSTPEWLYESDVPFFDSSWTDPSGGFYGIRPIAASSPLSFANLSNNILAERDLDDEDPSEGTNGFATTTFSTIDISTVVNAHIMFDWEVIGYDQTNDQAFYELVYDGVSQGDVLLAGGGGATTNGNGTVIVNIPDAVSQIALSIKIRNNGTNGYSGFDNFQLSGSYAGLVYDGVSWTPSAPDSTTGAQNAIVLSGNPVISANTVVNNLNIVSGAGMTVDPTGDLTINGNLNTSNNLQLCSSSNRYPSLFVDGTTTGRVRYKRHVNAAFDNDLISAPLAGQQFNNFAAENPNIFQDPNSDDVLFGPFDNAAGNYLTWDQNSTQVMTSGQGYRAGRDANITPTIETFTFDGNIVNTDVTIPITLEATGTFRDWNSIGNPFSTYFRIRGFLNDNSSQFDPLCFGIYGYDGEADDGWIIKNLANTSGSERITPGQGFLVSSGVTSGSVLFRESLRIRGTSDDFIPGDEIDEEISYNLNLAIDATSGQSYKTDFYFNEPSTNDLDPGYDAAFFGDGAPAFAIYSKLVDSSIDEDFAIQSLNHLVVGNVTVPLGINITQGQQATISVGESTLPSGIFVYLEDNVANTFTLLNDMDYTFTANQTLTDTGRFFLHFQEETLSNPENTLSALQIFNTKDNQLFVKGLVNHATLKLVDLQGRSIFTTALDNASNSQSFNISQYSAGIYLVTIEDNTSSTSKKIIIR